MKVNTCKECRKIMRIWAKDWRRVVDPKVKEICLAMAKEWRSGFCIHN